MDKAVALLLLAWSLAAAAPQASSEGMTCQPKVAVLYSAGPNWENAKQYTPGHLRFLREGMKNGLLLVAGAFTSDRGGLLIFNLENPKEVAAKLQADPFVAHKVVNHAEHRWQHCRPSQ